MDKGGPNLNTYLCSMTLVTTVDPDPIEVDGSSPEEARKDLQRQHMSWDAPEVTVDTSQASDADSYLLEIFEELDEEDSDFYGGDGVEEASMAPIEGDMTYIHIRWLVSFEFSIQGTDQDLISEQLEDLARRCILINGLRVDKVAIELNED